MALILNFLLFCLLVFFCISFWKMADVAYEEGRKFMAYVYLFFSALNGAQIFDILT
jgi:hypothetical protein